MTSYRALETKKKPFFLDEQPSLHLTWNSHLKLTVKTAWNHLEKVLPVCKVATLQVNYKIPLELPVIISILNIITESQNF